MFSGPLVCYSVKQGGIQGQKAHTSAHTGHTPPRRKALAYSHESLVHPVSLLRCVLWCVLFPAPDPSSYKAPGSAPPPPLPEGVAPSRPHSLGRAPPSTSPRSPASPSLPALATIAPVHVPAEAWNATGAILRGRHGNPAIGIHKADDLSAVNRPGAQRPPGAWADGRRIDLCSVHRQAGRRVNQRIRGGVVRPRRATASP